MRVTRVIAVVGLSIAAVGCGADDSSSPSTGATSTTVTLSTTSPPSTAGTTTTVAPTTVPPTTTTLAPTTTVTTVAPTTVAPSPVMAIWPAADVVFSTPEAAAADFVAAVLGAGPTLGEYQAGDSQSGEITLISPAEGTAPDSPRGTILVRRIGEGWFVIGVANGLASIETPESGATVPAADLTVTGVSLGFESNVVVRAFVAGDAAHEFDRVVTLRRRHGGGRPVTPPRSTCRVPRPAMSSSSSSGQGQASRRIPVRWAPSRCSSADASPRAVPRR